MSDKLSLHQLSELASRIGMSEQELLKFVRNIGSHVRIKNVPKPNGKMRRIYQPSSSLKLALKIINVQLLQLIDLPQTLQGGIPGTSTLSNASMHLNQLAVVNLDIKDFFPSIHYTRVYKLFQSLDCSPDVSRCLTRLTTYENHLAQGFPTSSTIANLILKEIEPRFAKLCHKHNLSFTFFQDDLTVSGSHRSTKLVGLLITMLTQCGFNINRSKIKIATTKQRQQVTGIIVNERPNVSKEYYRNLRATIHNCIEYGLESQTNEDPSAFLQSLHGKIQWVKSVSPARGEKLLKQFRQIQDST
jgi:retron-type reverse transcriptase